MADGPPSQIILTVQYLVVERYKIEVEIAPTLLQCMGGGIALEMQQSLEIAVHILVQVIIFSSYPLILSHSSVTFSIALFIN